MVNRFGLHLFYFRNEVLQISGVCVCVCVYVCLSVSKCVCVRACVWTCIRLCMFDKEYYLKHRNCLEKKMSCKSCKELGDLIGKSRAH